MNLFDDKKWNRLAAIISTIIVLLGIALRVWVYFQGRDLIIDEANITRNIYDRDFIGLLKPLDYQQYAPPFFLWVTKLISLLLGFSEWALKIYPFVCGVISCLVFYQLAKKLMPKAVTWFPLSLFAITPILIRYATELKQYSSDVLVVLLLILLAISTDINKTKPIRFILVWILMGVFSVFASMPSVFVLVGVGCYYGWQCVSCKEYKKLLLIVVPVLVWLGAFAIYYVAVLQAQANSDYLQDFHHYYFLFATPTKQEELNHNFYVFYALMYTFEGVKNHAHDINRVLLLVGLVSLFIKNKSKFFLLSMPLFCLFVAAAMDKFSMMPRVSLFIIPVIILVIGIGFAYAFAINNKLVKIVVVACGVYAISCNVKLLLEEDFKYEQITQGMQFLLDKGLKQDKISIYHSSIPAFKYYTEIHPQKEKWSTIKKADLLQWHTNYDSLGWFMQNIWSTVEPKGFLYTNTTAKSLRKRDGGINKHLKRLDSLVTPQVQAYVYIKTQGSKTD